MKKENRHRLIHYLLQNKYIYRQEELVDELRREGYDVTQATVSRDIKEMNVIRIPTYDGSMRYYINNVLTQKESPMQAFIDKLNEVSVAIEWVTNLVIIKTMPGNADLLGALLDQLEFNEKVGTVCGNDTCLIICTNDTIAEQFYQKIIKYKVEEKIEQI